MYLDLKFPYKSIFSVNFAQIALAAFAILAGLVASGSVFLNDLYFWGQSGHYINPYLCLMAFFLALSPKLWGFAAIIFLLPLSAGLGNQLNAYLGTQFLILPNAGLDLAAGFFLGCTLRVISRAPQLLDKKSSQDFSALLKVLIPWPIALVITIITISTAIAISRNVYQSAAATSFKGLLFNLVHFRPIGWHDDYMPISDWIAYALAVAMIIVVIGQLRDQENKNQIIFRPIMAGLIVAALMGMSQAVTGLGLPENLLSFRKDQLGYAVIGFQPDLHAFAGHMLLGAVGLWGYFYSGISKLERKLVLFAVAMCWVGLILSKSRALFLLALAAMFVWLLWSLWQKKSHLFLPTVALLVGAISIFIVIIFNYSNHLSGIPVLSWLGELANEFKIRDLTSWSLFSGIFGARFEIWEAAIRMWWEFPLMGIGQGNFYRLSEIASFSKSHFLILNKGENAHNYFLQVLTETGLVGVAVFILILLSAFFGVKDKRILIAGVSAVSSLFLGNIFSHSFLVRENLILLVVLLGLLYSLNKNKLRVFNYPSQARLNYLGVLLLLTITFFGIYEVAKSYGKSPFLYGIKCFVLSTLYPDGWTGATYIKTIPMNSTAIELELKNGRKNLDRNLLSAYLKVTPIRDNFTYPDTYTQIINIKLSDDKKKHNLYLSVENLKTIEPLPTNLELQLSFSSCYTPRNYGDSIDSRRLGGILKNLRIIDE
jgi:O-antigen ligase